MAVAKSPLNPRRASTVKCSASFAYEGTFGGVGAELLQPDLHVLHRRLAVPLLEHYKYLASDHK